MEHQIAMLQTIKTEMCDSDEEEQNDCSSVHGNDLIKQKQFSVSPTCFQRTECGNSFDDDIDLDVKKVTPANYDEVLIKKENEAPNETQTLPEAMLEANDDEDIERNIKMENGSSLALKQPSSPVNEETIQLKENDVSKLQPSSSKATTHSLVNLINQLGENKQYKCDRCEKSFCDRMELKVHKRNHQFTVCPVCKRTMRTDFVKRHIARVHPDDGILPKTGPFPCNECERVFSNNVLLKNHQQSHKKQNCPVCRRLVRADYMKRHMDLNHPEEVTASDGTMYQCDLCDTALSNKYALFFHRRTHLTEECPVCRETLRVGYLKIHIDTKHPNHSTLPANPTFNCEQCERVFGYKAALTLHRRKHRLTECPVCRKTVRADGLKRHVEFHHPSELVRPENDPDRSNANTEPPLLNVSKPRSQQTEDCPECGETFRNDYIKLHVALKHPNVGAASQEKPFRCDQCEKSYAHKTQLRLHKRNHRMTECTICQKSMRMDCLRLHMRRMHPGDKSGGQD